MTRRNSGFETRQLTLFGAAALAVRASAMTRGNADFKAAQLALFGAAAFVLLVCAWPFVRRRT
jgi:hypothetical protein